MGQIVLTGDGGHELAKAIMTIVTVPKEAAVRTAGGGFIIGGVAKGSGMIHPDLATLLCFLTTDASVDVDFLKLALRKAVDVSFNMVSIDGDTSPNDTVLIMADGLAGNELIVQVGWGGGWESKTLGSELLRQDDRAFERLLSQYRMTKGQGRRAGDPFPKSRHLVLRGGQPAEPLGWIKVRLEGLEEMPAVQPGADEEPQPPVVLPGQQTGRVARFFDRRGFGFIEPDAGGPIVDAAAHVGLDVGESRGELRMENRRLPNRESLRRPRGERQPQRHCGRHSGA